MRNNIRQTWKTLGSKEDILTVFVIGLNKSGTTNEHLLPSKLLTDEARMFNDLLFVETSKVHPYSLSRKALSFSGGLQVIAVK